jgi:hypothetical protein
LGDLSTLKISHELPPAGAPHGEHLSIEGGGLAIDFVAAGSTEARRVVFGFNGNGMWVEFDSIISSR